MNTKKISDDARIARTKNHWGFGRFDLSKPSKAVVAIGQDERGAVLEYGGCDITMEFEETGITEIEDLGLLWHPGLWVWEGRGVWHEGPYDCPQDGDFVLEGTFRPLSEEERDLVAFGALLWDPGEWAPPGSDLEYIEQQM